MKKSSKQNLPNLDSLMRKTFAGRDKNDTSSRQEKVENYLRSLNLDDSEDDELSEKEEYSRPFRGLMADEGYEPNDYMQEQYLKMKESLQNQCSNTKKLYDEFSNSSSTTSTSDESFSEKQRRKIRKAIEEDRLSKNSLDKLVKKTQEKDNDLKKQCRNQNLMQKVEQEFTNQQKKGNLKNIQDYKKIGDIFDSIYQRSATKQMPGTKRGAGGGDSPPTGGVGSTAKKDLASKKTNPNTVHGKNPNKKPTGKAGGGTTNSGVVAIPAGNSSAVTASNSKVKIGTNTTGTPTSKGNHQIPTRDIPNNLKKKVPSSTLGKTVEPKLQKPVLKYDSARK